MNSDSNNVQGQQGCKSAGCVLSPWEVYRIIHSPLFFTQYLQYMYVEKNPSPAASAEGNNHRWGGSAGGK